MDIVDSQIHFGPGGTAEVLAEMDALGIQACLVDEFWGLETWGPGYTLANGTFRPTRPTVELAAIQHPDRFAYVARVERTDPEVQSLIRIAADDPNARAIRMIPGVTATETDAFAAGDYADAFTAARETCMPMFLFIGGQVELVKPYLEAFPDVHFIIDHCGMPLEAGLSVLGADTPAGASHPGPDVTYFDEVMKLADFTNVALKWSHAQGMFGELEYPSPGLIPYLRKAIDAFGVERIMWASDNGGGNQTGETWEQLLHYLLDSEGVSDEEKIWLFGRAVRTALDWPVP